MKKILSFLILFAALVCNGQNIILSGKDKTLVNAPAQNEVLLIMFAGESNAVGYANNSDATGSELGSRAKVKILNGTTLLFETLNIGTNNDFEISGQHGWELQLANQMDSGGIAGFTEVYIVKFAKGGTKIADWNTGGTWESRMQTRMSAALSIISGLGKTARIVCWYSQGINDVGTTLTADWISGTTAFFSHLRSLYGAQLPILMTKFQPAHTRFNGDMDTIDAADTYLKTIDATGTTLKADGAHWDYAGTKEMAKRLITITLTFF